MNQDAASTPEFVGFRLGPLTLLCMLALAVMQAAFGFWAMMYLGSVATMPIWIGLMWLGVSVTTTFFFSVPSRWCALGAMLLGIQILWMSWGTSQPPVRYVLAFGVLGFLQHLTTGLLRMPRPVRPGASQRSVPAGSFSIRGLMLATACIAVLLAAVRVYRDEAVSLRLIVVAIPLLVLLHVLASSVALGRDRIYVRGFILVAVLVGGALLFNWVGFVLTAPTGNTLTLSQFVNLLTSPGRESLAAKMRFLSFGIYAFGNAAFLWIARIDQQDWMAKCDEKPESATQPPATLKLHKG